MEKLCSFIITLFLTFAMFLPNTSAQDYTKWDLPEGATRRIGKGRIYEIKYSPDGNLLAVASSIGIWLYDAETGKELDLLTGHTSSVESVCFSPDGRTIASASWDKTIRLWDATTGQHLKTLTGHTLYVDSVRFSPDRRTIASGGRDGTILLWDTRMLNSLIPPKIPAPTTQDQTSQTPQQIAKSVLTSTVLIVMEDANGKSISSGSGFFIERGMIATNLHVVEGVLKGYVKRVGTNKKYPIIGIAAMDSRQDLAILIVSDFGAPILPLGNSDKVQVGESIYVAGNPIGFLEGTFSNGIVSGVREFRVDSKRIQITAPISKGSSGGPVLNSKGEVIGVAVSTITAGQNLNFAIPSDYLNELLNKVKGQR